jgi:hypothetical protein
MEGLSDLQLETVFRLCDKQDKGYMSAYDLKLGLAQTAGGDDNAADHIVNLLGLGPDDTLNLQEVKSRRR